MIDGSGDDTSVRDTVAEIANSAGNSLNLRWIPSPKDDKHFTRETLKVSSVEKMFFSKEKKPEKIDLRKWFSPIENQRDLGSCTANAAVGILEYFEKRNAFKSGDKKMPYTNRSRIFVYKTTRNLMKLQGDTGADIATTMKSLVLFGAPPEKYCPYTSAISEF